MKERTVNETDPRPVVCELAMGVLLATVSLTALPQHATADESPKVRRDLISSIGSERATSGNGNKIVTVDGKSHVVWQDATQKGYFARIRTLDHKTGEWAPTYTIGEGRDNHARPTKSGQNLPRSLRAVTLITEIRRQAHSIPSNAISNSCRNNGSVSTMSCSRTLRDPLQTLTRWHFTFLEGEMRLTKLLHPESVSQC